jgi:polyhydroxyalkanoate synthesis repressor PhaR
MTIPTLLPGCAKRFAPAEDGDSILAEGRAGSSPEEYVVEQPADRQPRVIRRYANRKLYDATESRYVTLQDVESLVHRGVEVRVVDNRTGEDVTQTALAQILCDAGRRRDPRYSLSNILSIFRGHELEERVREFLRRRGDDKGKAAVAPAEAPVPAVPPAAGGQTSREEAERFVRDVVSGIGRGVEDLQRRIDDGIRHAVNEIEPLRRLNAEVRSLTERLAAVERALRERKSRGKGKHRGAE